MKIMFNDYPEHKIYGYYSVVAYDVEKQNEIEEITTLWCLDEELNINEIYSSDYNILEFQKSEFEEISDSRFILKRFIPYLKIIDEELRMEKISSSDHDFWVRCKLSPFFIEKNYKIPNYYRLTVFEPNYKLGRIAGFIESFNTILEQTYNNFKVRFGFHIHENCKDIHEISEETISSEQIINYDVGLYREVLNEFIFELDYFSLSKEIDDARINLLMGLFYNIDTFFNKSIDTLSILKINEYKESLMIGYNENLYEVIRFKFPKIDFY